MANHDEQYHAKDTITRTIRGAAGTGTVGLFVSAVQNALSRQRPNAWGVFTRTGSTAAVFCKVSMELIGEQVTD